MGPIEYFAKLHLHEELSSLSWSLYSHFDYDYIVIIAKPNKLLIRKGLQ